jgi:hypothetical protein
MRRGGDKMTFSVKEVFTSKGIPMYQVYMKYDGIEKPLRGAVYKNRNDAIDRVKWEQITRPALFRNTAK